jgi:uridine phosphorylase
MGVARSHDGFYIPHNNEIEDEWAQTPALGQDMETSLLFIAGLLKGMQTACILNNVVNYGEDTAASIGNYASEAEITARSEKVALKMALDCLAA